ncbi:MAG: hypothetical protein OXL96_13940 [Candidatus Poribacteria bacterium]|nr:hypothetical protein [Candidatus Poribacteria bacterium]
MNFRNTSLLAILAILAIAFIASADTGTLGLNYTQAVEDTAWGVHGDYERTVDSVDIEVEGQLQSGDLYFGNVDASAQFNISAIGVRLSSLNQLQGPSLGGLGRQNTLDAALVVPAGDLEFAVGIFGQNGNPFAPQYELSDASEPLSEVIETEAGITIPEGNRWGVSVASGLDVSIFEVDLKALLDPSNVTHQARIGIGTGGDLWEGVGWSAKATLALQSHEQVVEVQSTTIVGVAYQF